MIMHLVSTISPITLVQYGKYCTRVRRVLYWPSRYTPCAMFSVVQSITGALAGLCHNRMIDIAKALLVRIEKFCISQIKGQMRDAHHLILFCHNNSNNSSLACSAMCLKLTLVWVHNNL